MNFARENSIPETNTYIFIVKVVLKLDWIKIREKFKLSRR